MSIEPTFTYQPLSFRKFFSLIGADADTYCEIVQPEECKRRDLSFEQTRACQKIFEACREFAAQFERWDRLGG